jgi:hypothetical protein
MILIRDENIREAQRVLWNDLRIGFLLGYATDLIHSDLRRHVTTQKQE